MISWLKHYHLPFSIIVNKIDKIRPSKLDERKKDIAVELVVDACDIFWVSSKKNIGIANLHKKVAKLLDTRCP